VLQFTEDRNNIFCCPEKKNSNPGIRLMPKINTYSIRIRQYHKFYTLSKTGGAKKTLPCPAARPRIANIWECPPHRATHTYKNI